MKTKITNPTSKVPVFLNIDEVMAIDGCSQNYAYETVKEVKKRFPTVKFNRSRVPSNLLIEILGITMEQAEQRLLEAKNKNNFL